MIADTIVILGVMVVSLWKELHLPSWIYPFIFFFQVRLCVCVCVYTCVYDCMYVCVHMHLCDYRDTCHLQVAPLATSNFVVTFRAYRAPVSVLCVLIVLLSRMLLKLLFSHFPCHSCSTWAVSLVSTSLTTSVCIQMQLLRRSMPSSTSHSSWRASFVPQSLWLQSGCM